MGNNKTDRIGAADLEAVLSQAAALASERVEELGGTEIVEVNGGGFIQVDLSGATAGYLPPEPEGFVPLGGVIVR